jgi:diguanylate cyclase
MSRFFTDLSLSAKLLIASFCTLASVVLLTCVLMVADHYQEAKARLLGDASTQAELMAYSASPALAAGDRQGAKQALAALQLVPAVLSARLFDAHGRAFAEYRSERAGSIVPALEIPLAGGQRFEAQYLETYRPVMVRGQVIGVLAIAADLTPFRYVLVGFAIKAALLTMLALVITYVVIARLQSTILHPFGVVSRFVRRTVREKSYEARTLAVHKDEVGVLAEDVNALLDCISEREASLRQQLAERTFTQRRFDELAHYDPITKLPNRHYFCRQLERVLLGAVQSGSAGAVILVDLSNFGRINESLGHDAGDTLLLQLANRLNSNLRGGDMLCRLGGDEFALILEQTSGESQVAAVAEKMLGIVCQPIPLGEREVRVGASIGIAVFPVDGKEPMVLLRHAETAVQRAKAAGKNGYCFFAPEMLDKVQQQLSLVDELKRAVEQGELRLHFQPQVSLADGQMRGMEALLRWQHPQHGLLLPGDFVPQAEDNDVLIGTIVDWTLEAACAQIAAWRVQGMNPVPISVNVAAAQMRDGHLAQRLGELLSRYGVAGELIELEITENMLMSERGAVQVLDQIGKVGVRIAVASFGTGYSSLGLLKDLPITALKIDRGFVHDIAESAKFAAITRAIISLASDLGLETVAEGVESTRQVEFLRAMGCAAYQGYCFSPAVPAEDATRFLAGPSVAPLRHAVAGR